MELVVWLVWCMSVGVLSSTSPEIEKQAKELLDAIDKKSEPLLNTYWKAKWDYATNLADPSVAEKLKISSIIARTEKENWKKLMAFNWREFQDEDLKRKFKLNSDLGSSALPEYKFRRFTELVSRMSGIFSNAKVCDYTNQIKCDLSLVPEITEILKTSRDPEELAYYWKAWRNVSGKKMRRYYKEYVDLSNEIARLHNFTDAAENNMFDFESETFESDIQALWLNMEPLYKDLHAYVRGRLNEHYGDDVVSKDGPIPAQLLGNMWSQLWSDIRDLTIPFPEKHSVDVTQEMIKQGYTPLKMFKAAEDFFVSLNLSPMPDTFWNYSVIEKPQDGREIICHPTAWDLYDGKDFRISMCAVVSQQDFETIHHEMGHIQYFMQYKDQPNVYRKGANSGFHEAIGNVIAMSFSTPKHLKRIGLLPEDFELDKESSLNFLFLQALDKVANLPFIFLLDQWRWDVYRGKATQDNYNCHYWKLRTKYQGIQPPFGRSEDDFDPGAKYHIAANIPYVRYFVSAVLQFQFHKSLCVTAGEFDPNNPEANPLYNCDIYKSVKAGEKFGNMLKMGSSKPWPEALEAMTGTTKMSTDDLVEYFKPLQDWLHKENEKKGYKTGWTEPSVNTCKKSRQVVPETWRYI